MKQFETLSSASMSAADTISGMQGAIVAVIKTGTGVVARTITKRAIRKTKRHESNDMPSTSGIGTAGAPYTVEFVRPTPGLLETT